MASAFDVVLVLLLALVQLVSSDIRLTHYLHDLDQRERQDERNRKELNAAIKRQLDAYFNSVQPIDEEFNLPTKQVDDLKTVIKVSDTNHDGQLTVDEMRHLVDAKGVLTVKALEELMSAADTDHSGSLSVGELARYMARAKMPEEKINWDFNRDKARLLDLNKDGYIDMDEFQRMYRFCNQNFQRQLIQGIIKVGDRDNDKRISYTEMSSVLASKSDVMSAGGTENPSDAALERIKYCMSAFIEKCRKGWCNRPLTGFKEGKVSIVEVLKMPFMSSASSLTSVFGYSG